MKPLLLALTLTLTFLISSVNAGRRVYFKFINYSSCPVTITTSNYICWYKNTTLMPEPLTVYPGDPGYPYSTQIKASGLCWDRYSYLDLEFANGFESKSVEFTQYKTNLTYNYLKTSGDGSLATWIDVSKIDPDLMATLTFTDGNALHKGKCSKNNLTKKSGKR